LQKVVFWLHKPIKANNAMKLLSLGFHLQSYDSVNVMMSRSLLIASGFLTITFLIGFGVWQSQTAQKDLATEKNDWEKRDQITAEFEKQKKELFEQVLRYSGKGFCKESKDCLLIPYGPKLCEGGKRGNLIYSSLDVKNDGFLSALGTYNSFMDDYNAKSIRILGCVGHAKKAKCQDSACVADND
jgi:hypothetical protein